MITYRRSGVSDAMYRVATAVDVSTGQVTVRAYGGGVAHDALTTMSAVDFVQFEAELIDVGWERTRSTPELRAELTFNAFHVHLRIGGAKPVDVTATDEELPDRVDNAIASAGLLRLTDWHQAGPARRIAVVVTPTQSGQFGSPVVNTALRAAVEDILDAVESLPLEEIQGRGLNPAEVLADRINLGVLPAYPAVCAALVAAGQRPYPDNVRTALAEVSQAWHCAAAGDYVRAVLQAMTVVDVLTARPVVVVARQAEPGA